jgi:hypothetical protein
VDDLESQVAQLLADHIPEVQALAQALRRLVNAAAPELVEEVKTGWGNIVYKGRSVVCSITAFKQHADLGFYKGTSLSDPEGLLEGTGRGLRHVKIRKPEDIRTDALSALVRQAHQIDKAQRT